MSGLNRLIYNAIRRGNISLAKFSDDISLDFGSSKDVSVSWDGSVLKFIPLTDDVGAINIGNGTKDIDFKVFLGSTDIWAKFDVGNKNLETKGISLKIHNHFTTAEIGGMETKGELVNISGSVVGVQASWSYQPTGASGAPSGVSASSNVLAVAPAFTVTAGNIYALVGEAQLYGTLNGASVNVAGVIGVVGGNGANTLVLHMAGVQSAMSVGLVNPTTGTLSYFLANSLSTVVVDNLICSLQSQYITNFASFDAVGGCVVANTHSIDSHALQHIIVVKVGSDTGYIPVYADVPA